MLKKYRNTIFWEYKGNMFHVWVELDLNGVLVNKIGTVKSDKTSYDEMIVNSNHFFFIRAKFFLLKIINLKDR